MDYKLTDDRRKLLTEFLGEPWYYHRKDFYGLSQNRSFTTPRDWHDVFKKLVDGGKYSYFKRFAWEVFWNNEWLGRVRVDFDSQLFYSPERFCWLVSEWLKEGK